MLLRPDAPKVPMPNNAWTKYRPSLVETAAHAFGGSPIGLVPASLGCTVIDADSGDFSSITDLYPPMCSYPTRTAGHGHLWYQDSEPRHKRDFELCGCAGQIISGFHSYVSPSHYKGPRGYP